MKETLMFTAKFRLKAIDAKEREERADKLMKELDLVHVTDSFNRDEENRGISSGKKNRVSIGVDVIHDPLILLLGEPTSSLDSTSALQVIEMLFTIAKSKQRIVVLSIHQPSYRILYLISNFLILSHGSVVHNGSIELLEDHLQNDDDCIHEMKKDDEGVIDQLGLFAFSLSFLLSSTVESTTITLQERQVLMKKSSREAYNILSYMIAYTIVLLPFLFAMAHLFLVLVSLVLFLSVVSPDFISGNFLICTVLGASFLFSGYFFLKENIPTYWLFKYRVSLCMYLLDLLLTNEYWSIISECFSWHPQDLSHSKCLLTCNDLLKSRGLDKDTRWINVGIMFGFFPFYRVLCG
ncbi:ABC transporter G family member 23 [Pyrus ussuriensis x Pyrus communis]|uniref:ABC transporter G family member 23 n=1 Tax=Pyrus ussuriensis x Pyrus communis TaxID=2448454 RepID=A0A5N5GI92_9ROSA|nr:ABC transporter G family member 23 [Pyrus ussuriensis x Pyrus communis]